MGLKLKAKSGGGDFESPPAGNHPAVCVAVIDLGTQETSYQNNVEWKQQVYLVWELVTEKMAGMKDKNFLIGKVFTASLHEKAMLRGFIDKWRGVKLAEDTDFDLERLVGQPCLLSVVRAKSKSTGNEYAKIETATAVPKGMAVPKPQNVPFFSSLEDDKDIPEWVPFIYGEKVQDVINRCQEAKQAAGETASAPAGAASAPAEAPVGDSIPF